MQPALWLPIGIQGSGKTTWREEQQQKYGLALKVISPDEIRMTEFHTEFDPRYESQVWELVRQRLDACLSQKHICLLDATNAAKKWRAMPIELARAHTASVEGFYFPIHPRYAVLRNSKRERKVPSNRIYLYHYQLLDDLPTPEEGFTRITTIPQNPTREECRELDGIPRGTLCRLIEEIPLQLHRKGT